MEQRPQDGAETPGRTRDPRMEQRPQDGAETPGRSRDPRMEQRPQDGQETPGWSRDPRTKQRPQDRAETSGWSRDLGMEQRLWDGAKTPGWSRDPTTERRPHDGAEIPGQSRDPRTEQSPGHSLAEPQLTHPQHTPCPEPGWQVPGLALPACAELLDGLGPGQGVAIAVIHLDAVVADTHGVGGQDPWVQDKGRAPEPTVSSGRLAGGPRGHGRVTRPLSTSWFQSRTATVKLTGLWPGPSKAGSVHLSSLPSWAQAPQLLSAQPTLPRPGTHCCLTNPELK